MCRRGRAWCYQYPAWTAKSHDLSPVVQACSRLGELLPPMERAVSSKQKSVLGLLLPVFEETPRIQPRLLTQEYQRFARRNFSPRSYGFQGNEDLVYELNVFDRHDGAISVSESKLFDLLLLPLLNMRLSPHELDDAFVRNNGFHPAILCRYSKVENLQQLVEKYTSSASSVQVVLPREACSTERISACNVKEKSALAHLIPLFQSMPRIKPNQLAHHYQRLYRANFSPRTFGFGNIYYLIAKLDVFDIKDDGSISLSESKLLGFLVHPLLTDHQPPLEQAFERENGFKSTILCKYCKVKTLQQLVDKCVGSATAVQADNSAHLPLTTEPVRSSSAKFPPLGYAGPSPPKRAFLQEQAPAVTASHHLQTHPPLSQTHRPVSQTHPPLSQTHQPFSQTHQPVSQTHRPVSQAPPPLSQTLQPVTSPHPPIEHYPNSDIPLREETFLPALPSVRKDMEVPKSSSQLRFPSFSKLETKQQAQEKLEVYLQNYIAHLSQQRKHLPADVVVAFTRQSISRVNSILGRQLLNWTNIQCVSNFSKCYGRVSEFIRCFCWNTTITSLFELQKAIVILEECTSFDDLQMGPILTHPLVKDFFKPPADVISVPEITGYDIQTQLATFIYKHKKGTKYNLPDFLNYFAEQQSVSDPDHLCIRISSFPLALTVSSIYKSQ